MIYLVNGYHYKAHTSVFPGGEEHVQLPRTAHPVGDDGEIEILGPIRTSQDIMRLLLLNDTLRRQRPNGRFILNLGYLPYARQDRVCNKGEAFSLKVFCELINNMKFDKVLVADCHSLVGLALLNNVEEYTQVSAFTDTCQELYGKVDAIISPDAGATKKAQEIADVWNLPLIQCQKTRKNGRIDVEIYGDTEGKTLLVVDDICDGGGTFLALAAKLQDAKSLNLYVTHGIFSKGRDSLLEVYDQIFSYIPWDK